MLKSDVAMMGNLSQPPYTGYDETFAIVIVESRSWPSKGMSKQLSWTAATSAATFLALIPARAPPFITNASLADSERLSVAAHCANHLYIRMTLYTSFFDPLPLTVFEYPLFLIRWLLRANCKY